MQKKEFSLGLIKIHETVISQIASEAICEIEGVAKLSNNFRNNIYKLLGRKMDTPGIKVSTDNNQVKLDVFVIIRYGVSIPEIANKIQENVKVAVEKMTNLSLLDINVNIQGIERGK